MEGPKVSHMSSILVIETPLGSLKMRHSTNSCTISQFLHLFMINCLAPSNRNKVNNHLFYHYLKITKTLNGIYLHIFCSHESKANIFTSRCKIEQQGIGCDATCNEESLHAIYTWLQQEQMGTQMENLEATHKQFDIKEGGFIDKSNYGE
ncbi:hypothetical protein J1N35_005680 [Gossypium stocksii]|uniref:Uncharacterized protein n=1 Tax=Gossypium stocksii TaxID=47602 RepID=A0A9D3WG91_9ROSI|nr:hypothetical protein J1N35_005680 [Gossypium stocksii]